MKKTKETHGGLTTEEAAKQRERYGSNALPKRKPTPFFKLFLKNLGDPIVRILIAALFINFLFLSKTFDVFETLGILFAIVSAASISALSERGGERAFEKLWEETSHTAVRVMRDGAVTLLPIEAPVVGDTVLLASGEQIPADGVLTEGEIKVSLAALNGESKECRRTVPHGRACTEHPDAWSPDNDGVLLRGSVITAGEGQMRVMRVGEGTLYGSLIGELGIDTRESPLRTRLSHLAVQMSRVGGIAAVLVALSYLLHTFYIDAGGTWAGARMLLSDAAFVGNALLHALMLATTTVVMAVPEGLPMMISVVLSSNIKKMQRDRVLIKKPVGIETAGSMNLLFCDKTGTLTCGRPSVVGIVTGDGTSYATLSELAQKAPAVAAVFAKNAYYNTQCAIPKARGDAPIGGNATERALLSAAFQASFKKPNVLRISGRVPFDSEKKYSSVELDGVCYFKGAPEVLLSSCKLALTADGGRVPIPYAALEARLSALAADAMRVLALCTEVGGVRTFAAFLCIRDAVRPDAREAVEALQAAGVQVVMITGDNPETATAIARACGILPSRDGESAMSVAEGRRGSKSGRGMFMHAGKGTAALSVKRAGGVAPVHTLGGEGLVLTSAELAAQSDEALSALLPRLAVVARALPQDKSRLVRLAQAKNLTVGMTGDGVNDAPALRAADVGFAMGSGTEVAKAAGDIVISDDAVSSIAKAVLYGRTVFKNIRKFIMFQMTTNLSAVAISVICPLLGIETPITVLQMLWINMIMDTLGSLAFAAEPPSPHFMREAPLARGTPIMNRYMVLRIFSMCIWLPLLCVSFLSSETMREHFSYYETPVRFLGAFFALFVFADICNSVSARTLHPNPLRGLWKNKAFVFIFALIICVQLLIIYFGGAVFRTFPLSPREFSLVLFFAALTLPVSAVLKLAMRRFGGV